MDGTNVNGADAHPHIVALVNPVAMHRETTAFSAQGLMRTFALAVDAALCKQSWLLVAETSPGADVIHALDPSVHHDTFRDTGEADGLGTGPGPNHGMLAAESPWDQQVSILNVTTKSFGIGDRGWAGRTVTVREIAERWFEFVSLQPAQG